MPAAEDRAALSPFRVLVVEDEFLIAMELDGILRDGGFEVLGPAPTVAAALRELEAQRPGAAVLDASLRGEMATPVAEVLLAMAVPFVLASAYLPADLAGAPALAAARNLGKPAPRAALLAAMREYRAAAPG